MDTNKSEHSSDLPLSAWAVLDGDELALTDARLPLFWRDDVAERYNATTLGGTGLLVRVLVTLESK